MEASGLVESTIPLEEGHMRQTLARLILPGVGGTPPSRLLIAGSHHSTAHSAQQQIGIIGGSGLYDLAGLEQVDEQVVSTPFGEPSDAFVTGA